jgi:cytochrome P450
LTPNGKKRHAMSFGPFLGGKRICLGKTFVETMSKIIGPSILGNFDFEFVDKNHYIKKPANNMMSLHEPIVYVKVKEIAE